MKNFRKITASTVLISMFLLNVPVVNSEWIHKTERLHHAPFWLASKEVKNATKDKQLCKIATSFDILNKDWTIKYTYYPQGCQPKVDESISNDTDYENNDIDSNNQNEDWVNNFIKWLFSDELTETDNENIWTESDENIVPVEDDFVEDKTEPDNSTQDADDILKEIFWKTNENINISLKGSKLISTIRNFSKSKVKIRVGSIEANVLSNNMDYNLNVANLLKEVDDSFKIDAIKNSFAKKIWKVSYSFYTYKNTTDLETKKVFKVKLINDIRKLQKSYKILKKKDRIISKTLEKRGQL